MKSLVLALSLLFPLSGSALTITLTPPEPLSITLDAPSQTWLDGITAILAGVAGFQGLRSVDVTPLSDGSYHLDTADFRWVPFVPTPEPGTAALMGAGLLGLAWSGRRR